MSESISKSAFWQVLGKFSLQGIAFFTTPIFTRILSPENYGTVSLYNSWLAILMVVLSLQTYGSIANARVKYDTEEINKYISSIFSISIIAFGGFSVLFFVFKNYISLFLGLDAKLVAILVIHSFFNYTIAFYVAYLDQHKKVTKSCLVSLITTIASTLLSLIFVLKFDNKVYAKVFGQFIPFAIFGIFLIVLIYKKGRCVWNSKYNKYCIAFTIPLVIHGLGHMVFTQADHVLLQRFSGEYELGIYSVAYALCTVVVIIFNALNTAWIPFYYDYKKENNFEEIIKHSKSYIRVVVFMMSGFVLLAFDVFKFMAPPTYYGGMTVIPIFVISFYFSYLYLFPVNFEYYHEQTKLIPVATFATAIINIILDIILIPKYMIMGAAVATMVSQFVLFAFHFIAAEFMVRVEFDYKLRTFLVPTAFLIFMCLAASYLRDFCIIRWCLFFVIALVLFVDVYKRKAIF